MSLLAWIMILSTITTILLSIYLFLSGYDDYGFSILMMGILVFGFIGCGLLMTLTFQYDEEKCVECEYFKSENKVIVDCGLPDEIWKFESHKDYVSIDDSTKFSYKIYYNQYGFEMEKSLIWKNE